eukprot:Awhi_evm2s2874
MPVVDNPIDPPVPLAHVDSFMQDISFNNVNFTSEGRSKNFRVSNITASRDVPSLRNVIESSSPPPRVCEKESPIFLPNIFAVSSGCDKFDPKSAPAHSPKNVFSTKNMINRRRAEAKSVDSKEASEDSIASNSDFNFNNFTFSPFTRSDNSPLVAIDSHHNVLVTRLHHQQWRHSTSLNQIGKPITNTWKSATNFSAALTCSNLFEFDVLDHQLIIKLLLNDNNLNKNRHSKNNTTTVGSSSDINTTRDFHDNDGNFRTRVTNRGLNRAFEGRQPVRRRPPTVALPSNSLPNNEAELRPPPPTIPLPVPSPSFDKMKSAKSFSPQNETIGSIISDVLSEENSLDNTSNVPFPSTSPLSPLLFQERDKEGVRKGTRSPKSLKEPPGAMAENNANKRRGNIFFGDKNIISAPGALLSKQPSDSTDGLTIAGLPKSLSEGALVPKISILNPSSSQITQDEELSSRPSSRGRSDINSRSVEDMTTYSVTMSSLSRKLSRSQSDPMLNTKTKKAKDDKRGFQLTVRNNKKFSSPTIMTAYENDEIMSSSNSRNKYRQGFGGGSSSTLNVRNETIKEGVATGEARKEHLSTSRKKRSKNGFFTTSDFE